MKDNKKVRHAVSVDEKTHSTLKNASKDLGLKIQWIVREAISAYLNALRDKTT